MNKELIEDILTEDLYEYDPEKGDSREYYLNALKSILHEIESYEGDWIPYDGHHVVPNSPRPVLVTYKWADDDYEVSQAEFWDIKDHELNEEYGFGKHDKYVIAWKELPQPYKEDL